MKAILNKAMRLLSEKHRLSLYRKMFRLPDGFHDPDFRVEIAQTQEDLKSAYALLHDCYVGIKIIDPQPSGLRCNLYSFLPTSSIIVVKHQGRVIGTVCAIKDSSSGLPSDREFLEENNRFRQQGKALIEVSAFAVTPEYRKQHRVSLMLLKYLFLYCRNCFRGDIMIGVVHPKAEDFYRALWLAEKNGKPVRYGSLKGAEAIHLTMEVSKEHFDKLTLAFGEDHPTKNLGTILRSRDSRFYYPAIKKELGINPVITPKLLRYFCLEQKGVWSSISAKDKRTLMNVYSTFFGASSMNEFQSPETSDLVEREYRTSVRLTSVASIGAAASFCKIMDLTSNGCFINWSGDLPSHGQEIQVSFCFQERIYSISGKVAWSNDVHLSSHARGFGIKFTQAVPELTRALQNSLYGNLIDDMRPSEGVG